MNVFAVDGDPVRAAIALCDTHVSKMVLESAQILSTIVRKQVRGRKSSKLYKPTHVNHPCTKWAGETRANFRWLVRHAQALAEEFTYRNAKGRVHASLFVINLCATYIDRIDFRSKSRSTKITVFAQAMPVWFQSPKNNPELADAIAGYRRYYCIGKRKLLRHTNREPPTWLRGFYTWKVVVR
jgi:hypothetical protein